MRPLQHRPLVNVRLLIGAPLLGATLLAAPLSHSLDVDLAASARSDFSNNTARTATNETSEWVLQPGLVLGAQHESNQIELEADYTYFRRLYQEDLFDDENAATGKARLLYNAVPGRLQFEAQNTRTETSIRSVAADNPRNRQITGNTQAGPTVRFQVRGKDELQVQYLYGQRTSDRTDSDATSHTAVVRYVLTTSTNNSLSFEAIGQKVQFENPLSPDLESKVGQVVWERQSNTLAVEATAGYKKIERELNRDDVDEAIGKIDLRWQFGPTSMLSVGATRDVRDQSRVLGFGSEEFGQRLVSDSDLNEVFIDTGAYIQGQRKFGETRVSAAYFSNAQDFEDVARDVDYSGLRLGANRKLNRRMTLDASVQFIQQDFSDQNIEFDQIISSIRLRWRLNRLLTLSASVFYDERKAEESLFDPLGYDEVGGSLRLDYKIFE